MTTFVLYVLYPVPFVTHIVFVSVDTKPLPEQTLIYPHGTASQNRISFMLIMFSRILFLSSHTSALLIMISLLAVNTVLEN